MKRYLVFAGADYYPAGGWADFINSFDDIEEAKPTSLSFWCGPKTSTETTTCWT